MQEIERERVRMSPRVCERVRSCDHARENVDSGEVGKKSICSLQFPIYLSMHVLIILVYMRIFCVLWGVPS